MTLPFSVCVHRLPGDKVAFNASAEVRRHRGPVSSEAKIKPRSYPIILVAATLLPLPVFDGVIMVRPEPRSGTTPLSYRRRNEGPRCNISLHE